LSARQRAELCDALETAERLLRAATITFDVVDPRSDDALSAMTAYFDELDQRFPTGFDHSILARRSWRTLSRCGHHKACSS
jgi:hypothetical protein